MNVRRMRSSSPKPLIVLASAAAAGGANTQSFPAELRPLSIAAGTWLYHWMNAATADQKAGSWTWLEQCGWSANNAFMACSFTMNGPDGVVKSLAISTYNADDRSYWHYEAFGSGGDGASPFIGRMSVAGDTWTYDGKAGTVRYRVIYHYESATRVTLRIEESNDDTHWSVVARGKGRKQLS